MEFKPVQMSVWMSCGWKAVHEDVIDYVEGLTQVKKDENGEESRISSHEEIVFWEQFLSCREKPEQNCSDNQ